jgi:cell division protein FtsL
LSVVPDIRREEQQQYEIPAPRRQVHHQPKAMQGISFMSLLVLTIAITVTLYVCVEYLMLQTKLGQMDASIVTMEQDLATKRNQNDAAYEQLDRAVDLDYVYHVAVEELGMVYPNNNTVIAYESPEADYVRQYGDIPD